MFSAVNTSLKGDGGWKSKAELNPPCPPADDLHRYITVPVDYQAPKGATFQLYYELNTEFDRHRPTVMIPADAQQTRSWVGRADEYRSRFGLESFNVVVFQHRGSFCSRFPGSIGHDHDDWTQAYRWFRIENTVEDMERIRRDLLGDDGTMMLWGCSGVATTAAAYLKKYHRFVSRAVLGSFYLDPKVASEGAVEVFDEFLAENELEQDWGKALKTKGISDLQLLHVVQRLLYSDPEAARSLIRELARGDSERFAQLVARPGYEVRHFIRSAQFDWPQVVAFMYESNVPTDSDPHRDINRPVLEIGAPLAEAHAAGRINAKRWSREGLAEVSTKVLLFAGTRDHATPFSETLHLHTALPHSKLVSFRRKPLLDGYSLQVWKGV